MFYFSTFLDLSERINIDDDIGKLDEEKKMDRYSPQFKIMKVNFEFVIFHKN